MKPPCAFCGLPVQQAASSINRAMKQGKPVYCNRECAGMGRRKSKTAEEKKEAKRLYDIQYRATNPTPKARKAEYYQRTKDPEKERVNRKKRAPQHAEYCRRPEYKEWKRQYDQEYRARKQYGEFWEAFIALMLIEREVQARITKQEAYQINDTYNKKQRRRREYERLNGNKSEICTLGNP